MIPKIVHYVWMNGDTYPDKIKKCMDTWKKILPDYEFVKWDYTNFPRGQCKWVDQAYDLKKYAFCADYIRLYAMYKYGGVYLDTDVEVVKSYNDLLHLPYFIGREMPNSPFESGTFGCEPGNLLIKAAKESYEDRDFVNPDGSINDEPIPWVVKRCIDAEYTTKDIKSIEEFDYDPKVINIFPLAWFSPKEWLTGKIRPTKETYSVHHFAASWLTPKARLCMIISQKISPKLGHYVDYLLNPPHVIVKIIINAIKRKCGIEVK